MLINQPLSDYVYKLGMISDFDLIYKLKSMIVYNHNPIYTHEEALYDILIGFEQFMCRVQSVMQYRKGKLI